MVKKLLFLLLILICGIFLVTAAPPYNGLQLVSLDTNGAQFPTGAFLMAMSDNGRFIAYTHTPSEEANGVFHIYDRLTDQTKAYPTDPYSIEGFHTTRAELSNDGRYLSFSGYASNKGDALIYDLETSQIKPVGISSDGTLANNHVYSTDFSSDGRFVVFFSEANNLVSNDTNGTSDIFLHDRDADGDNVFDEPGAILTERVSLGFVMRPKSWTGKSTN